MPYNVTGILLSETYIVDSMGYIMADSLGYSVAGDSIRESNIYKAGVQTWVVTSNWFQLDHELGANRSFSKIYGRSLFLRSYYSLLKKDPVSITMPRVMKALKPLQFRKDNRLRGDYDFVLYEAADTLLPESGTTTSVTNRNLMHAQPRRILQDGIITIILPDGTKILPDGRKVQ